MTTRDGVRFPAAASRIRVLAPAAPYVAAAILSFALVWIAYDLGGLDWRVPLNYNGDALSIASHVKTVIETGWYEYQPNLGAPYGQFYYDYPEADSFPYAAIAVLSLAGHQFGVVMNLYFVLGFPAVAVGAVWFLRLIGVSRILSAALAVVFALAPYHFIQGEGHLFLATYVAVPFALGLVYQVARSQPLWRLRPDGPRWLRVVTGRNLGTVLTAVLLATSSTYYSILAMLLLAIAGIAALWRSHAWRRFFGAAAAGLLVVAVMVIDLVPDLLYQLAHGSNPAVLVRSPPESEIYALKLAQLLLPMPEHRFGPFRTLRGLYDQYYPLPSEEPALGMIAAAGFVAAVVIVVYLLLSAGRPRWRMSRELLSRLSVLSGLVLLAFLFGTVGGLSTLVSFTGLPIRAWGRIAIFIALLSLGVLGLLLDAAVRAAVGPRSLRSSDTRSLSVSVTTRSSPLRQAQGVRRTVSPSNLRSLSPSKGAAPSARLASTGAPRVHTRRIGVAGGVLAVLLMALAVWDQVPPVDATARAQRAADFDSDQSFVAGIQRILPAGSLVYQLPYIPFPESPPVNGVLDPEQLRMFLHSTDLRWSGGGIKGRAPVDRVGAYASLPVPAMLEKLAGIHARGIVVDRAAYTDHGAALVAKLAAATGSTPVDAPDGRFTFIRLGD